MLKAAIAPSVERSVTGFQAVFRAAGETEISQENIQDWLQMDEGTNSGFQCLAFFYFLDKASTVLFLIYFHQHYLYY
jgi:hypothetical protein